MSDVDFSLLTFPNGGISLMHWNSKTIWGGIVIGISQLLPFVNAGFFGEKAKAIGTAIGIILSAVGVRMAIAKGPDAAPSAPADASTPVKGA